MLRLLHRFLQDTSISGSIPQSFCNLMSLSDCKVSRLLLCWIQCIRSHAVVQLDNSAYSCPLPSCSATLSACGVTTCTPASPSSATTTQLPSTALNNGPTTAPSNAPTTAPAGSFCPEVSLRPTNCLIGYYCGAKSSWLVVCPTVIDGYSVHQTQSMLLRALLVHSVTRRI